MNWKITIKPTKTGVRVRTQCPLGHPQAEEISYLVEQAIALAARKGRR